MTHQKNVPCGLQSAMFFLVRDTMLPRTIIIPIAMLNSRLTNVLLQNRRWYLSGIRRILSRYPIIPGLC